MENERKDIKYQVEHGYKLYTLIHYVNKETLKEQHEKRRKTKASGIDKVTKEEYEKRLDENIDNLLVRMKKFSYKPLSVRRTYIPKLNGKLRPLGIPAYEDKLVQGVMANILNEIYEVGHKMSQKKKKAKQQGITKWVKENKHRNVLELIMVINQKLIGMHVYYGISSMLEELYKLYYHTRYAIISALIRRSQRKKTYKQMITIFERIPLAIPKIYKDIWCWAK